MNPPLSAGGVMSWITPFPTQIRVQLRFCVWGVSIPILTVEALPAACRPRKINSTAKFGEKLRPMFAAMYTRKE